MSLQEELNSIMDLEKEESTEHMNEMIITLVSSESLTTGLETQVYRVEFDTKEDMQQALATLSGHNGILDFKQLRS